MLDFSKPAAKFNSSVIYKVDDKFVLMVYGFAVNDGYSCETRLCIKNESSRQACESGIWLVCKDSCGDSKHFLQIDLGDYIRVKDLKCGDPKIRVGGFRDKFHVYGSNKLGELGQQLYSGKCKNEWIVLPSFNMCDLSECGDLKHFGVLPFRFLSFSSCGANIVLNSMSVSLCC